MLPEFIFHVHCETLRNLPVENWKAKGTQRMFFFLKATGQYLEVADFGMARVAKETIPFLVMQSDLFGMVK